MEQQARTLLRYSSESSAEPSDPTLNPFGVMGAPASLVLTLLFKFETGVAPYKVGSKWTIEVSENGSVRLEEAKQ